MPSGEGPAACSLFARRCASALLMAVPTGIEASICRTKATKRWLEADSTEIGRAELAARSSMLLEGKHDDYSLMRSHSSPRRAGQRWSQGCDMRSPRLSIEPALRVFHGKINVCTAQWHGLVAPDWGDQVGSSLTACRATVDMHSRVKHDRRR
jgi:hypothetical protein